MSATHIGMASKPSFGGAGEKTIALQAVYCDGISAMPVNDGK